jgi:hypothetical protein
VFPNFKQKNLFNPTIMAKNTAPTPPIQPNEVYLAEAIALHRDGLIDFRKKTNKPLQKKDIAHKIYTNSGFTPEMEQKCLSAAKNIENAQKIFGGKTRKEILDDIQRIYAADFIEIKKDSTIKLLPKLPLESFFRFKQYFMAMASKDYHKSDGVEVAQLDLFYVKENNVIRYNTYELTIKEAANFLEIKLQGKIQCYGTDTLLLIGSTEKYHTTTLIHISHEIPPSKEDYYHGYYLTYTPIGEKIAAPVILEFVKNEATFGCNDVPEKIKTLLDKTRRDVQPPVAKSKIQKIK